MTKKFIPDIEDKERDCLEIYDKLRMKLNDGSTSKTITDLIKKEIKTVYTAKLAFSSLRDNITMITEGYQKLGPICDNLIACLEKIQVEETNPSAINTFSSKDLNLREKTELVKLYLEENNSKSKEIINDADRIVFIFLLNLIRNRINNWENNIIPLLEGWTKIYLGFIDRRDSKKGKKYIQQGGELLKDGLLLMPGFDIVGKIDSLANFIKKLADLNNLVEDDGTDYSQVDKQIQPIEERIEALELFISGTKELNEWIDSIFKKGKEDWFYIYNRLQGQLSESDSTN